MNGEIIISGNKIELSRRGRGYEYIYILNRFVLEIYIGEKEGGRKKKERKKELQRVLRLNLSFLRSSIEPFSPTKFIVLPFPVKVFAEIDLGIKFFFFFITSHVEGATFSPIPLFSITRLIESRVTACTVPMYRSYF